MQRASGSPLVSLTDGLGFLRCVLARETSTYVDLGGALSAVYGDIVNFQNYSGGVLPLSESAVTALRTVMEEPAIRDKCVASSTDQIERGHRGSLFLAVVNVRTILLAELQRIDTYLVSKKGLFSAPSLIEDGAAMLPASLRTLMPQAADVDLKEAGKCLAFGLWTASGFHGLRAVESVTLAYMKKLGVTPSSRNWGAYVKDLRDAKADPAVIAVLDQIRQLHRNPLLHPEDSLDEAEAITLFGIVNSAIGAILKLL